MPIEIVWDNPEHTILRYDIRGKWTWEDLFSARDQVFALMDSVNAKRVDAIIHFKESLNLPPGAMSQLKQLREHPHPKAGLTVMVGANRFMRTMFGTFTKVYNTATGHSVDFVYAKSLEEARDVIARDRIRSS